MSVCVCVCVFVGLVVRYPKEDLFLFAQVRVVGQEGPHEEVEHAVRSAGG